MPIHHRPSAAIRHVQRATSGDDGADQPDWLLSLHYD